jgi:pimeloyl-ACP methyl ester carboxylesterase
MLIFLFACSDDAIDTDTVDTDVVDTDVVDTDVPDAPDYTADGAATVQVENKSTNVNDCKLEYTEFTPSAPSSDALIVLTHGFSRAKANMDGHARHLASWGLHVVTPTLCHASFTDADHPQNAKDIQALAQKLGATRVVYAGHSAGGLASWLAAASDPKAVGMIGLDPVDTDNLGVAASVSVPAYGLFGEAGDCNTDNNGLAWFGPHDALRVTEADHCDFESPTDGFCTAFCGSANPNYADADLARTVSALLTAAALSTSGADPAAAQYWTPGTVRYQALADAGKISPL